MGNRIDPSDTAKITGWDAPASLFGSALSGRSGTTEKHASNATNWSRRTLWLMVLKAAERESSRTNRDTHCLVLGAVHKSM